VDLGTTGLVFREEFDFGRVRSCRPRVKNAPSPRAGVSRGERRGEGLLWFFGEGSASAHPLHCSKGEGVPKHWNAANQENLKQGNGKLVGDLAPWERSSRGRLTGSSLQTAQMFWANVTVWLEKAAEQPVYGFVGAERGRTAG